MMSENNHNQNSNRLGLLTLIIFLFSLLLVSYGANGVRGTDQYWYFADAETIATGSPRLTNIFYPAKILREANSGTQPNYFMHNGPMLSAVGFLTQYFGIFYSWILLNAISHALCAIAIYKISKKYTSKEVAAWTTCLYIFSPIAIWQTLNLLQEQAYSGVLALALLGFVFRRNIASHMLLLLSLALGILSHPIFTALAFSYAILLVAGAIVKKRTLDAILGATSLIAFTLIKLYTNTLYPSSFQPDLSSIISGAIPGVTNMMWHYNDVPYPINSSLLIEKFIYAVQAHILELRATPLYMYTNIAILSGVLLLLFRFRTYREIILTTGLIISLYTAILLLMQTQARYQQIVAPASFVVIALAIYELRNRINVNLARFFGGALLLLTILLSALMAQKTRTQGHHEATAIENVRKKLQFLPETSKVLTLDSEHELKLSYILRPRDILVARSDLIQSKSLVTAIRLFKPDYLVSTNQIEPDFLNISKKELVVDNYLGRIHIYKLNPF